MNGKTTIPEKSWQAERDKLTNYSGRITPAVMLHIYYFSFSIVVINLFIIAATSALVALFFGLTLPSG